MSIIDLKSVVGERLLPIIEACAPLNVLVSLKTVREKYYIVFDGSKTYNNLTDWDKFWISFENYVKHLVISNNFECKQIKVTVPLKCTVFIGTLFDFLKLVDQETN